MRSAVRDVASERQKYVILTFMMDESTFRLHPNSETPQAGQGSFPGAEC